MTRADTTTIAQIALDAYRACGPHDDWTCAVDSALKAAGVETLGSLGDGYDLEQETDALAAVRIDGRTYVIVHDEQADRASCEEVSR